MGSTSSSAVSAGQTATAAQLNAIRDDVISNHDHDGTHGDGTVSATAFDGAATVSANWAFTGTVTVGVDDTGKDVKFFGATSGQYVLWDESADELVLAGDTKLSFHDAAGGENIIASANGHLEINSGTTLDITAPTVDLNSSTEFNIDTAILDVNATGVVTIDAAGLLTITGTNDAVGAIYLRANAGTSETIKIHADQGTSVTEGAESITILSDAGGIGIRSTANLANAVNVTVDGGTSSTITLFNDQGTAATEGAASIQLLSDAGGINIKSSLNGANAILLTADGGTSETILVHADQGTGTGSIKLLSDAGGIEINAGTDIILDANGADIFLKDGGTLFGTLTNSSGELVIKSSSSGTTAITFSGANVTLAGTVGSGAITSSGIIKTDNTTEATSTTDGSLQTDGGLSVAKDAVFGDDVKLLSDSSVVAFGADGDATLTHTNDTGLTLNSTNKLMFNDASQFIQGSSATVLSIGATDEIDLTATAVDLNGTLDVSGNATLNGSVTMGANVLFINESSHGQMGSGVGVVINQGAVDSPFFSLKSSDVDHGMSSNSQIVCEPDDILLMRKWEAEYGGLAMLIAGENAAFGTMWQVLTQGGTATTTKTTAARALIDFYCTEHDGSNSQEDVTDNGNLFVVRARVGDANVARMLVDEDGDLYSVTSAQTFDHHDDISMVRALDITRSDSASLVKSEWDRFVTHNEQDLIDVGVLGGPVAGVPHDQQGLINVTQLQRLHNGAIWQLHCRNQELESRMKLMEKQLVALGG